LVAAPGDPVPYGEDFYITSHGFFGMGHGAAMAPDGSFVIAWGEAFYGFGGHGFLADGAWAGSFNEPWGGFPRSRESIDVAARASGEFVVPWEAYQWDGDYFSVIRTRRFAVDGSPLAPEVDLGALPDGPGKVIAPSVADWPVLDAYLVVWAQDDPAAPGTDGFEIEIDTVTDEGPLGSVQVNTYTTGDQSRPELSVGADSSLVVVWLSDGSPGDDQDGSSVQGQWYSAARRGGGQFQVNQAGTGDQDHADVAAAPDGSFLVVWDGPSTGGDLDGSIQGRLFAPGGTPLSGDVQINQETAGRQKEPRVEAREDGSFLVVWSSPELLSARVVGADGLPAGSEIRVSSTDDPLRPLFRAPGLAAGPAGRFVVNWLNHDSTYYGDTMRARFLREELFTDGFESGDTSAWSSTVP
jgi:hypothetical protein